MKIAIQGHPYRGNEVIKILESLGGINDGLHKGNNPNCYYELHGNIIWCVSTKGINFKYCTLEEFKEEFPFKVGDKVKNCSDDEIGTILGFIDIDGELMYVVDFEKSGHANMPTEELKHYKEMKEERNITLTLDKAKEWYKKGGELKEIALQAYSEEELNLRPKSWEEFCKNYPVKPGEAFVDGYSKFITTNLGARNSICDKNVCPSQKSAEAHLAMIQLEQLRNCYRGLFITIIGMPVWCIVRYKGNLIISHRTWGTNETFLSFQSPEIAEKYLKNFESLIKQAGDLI